MRKFDVLYNFISPVTGRILLPTDYVFLGDDKGIATPAQIIKLINLPDLQDTYIWIGNTHDRPEPKQTIQLENLPDLLYNFIWLGDEYGRPQRSSVLLTTKFIVQSNTFGVLSSTPRAQALNTTIYTISPPNAGPFPPGIAKIEFDGSISIAIPDVDYALPVALSDLNSRDSINPQDMVTKHYVDEMINALEERLLKVLEQTVEKKISKL